MKPAHNKIIINLKSQQNHPDLRTYTRAGGFKALAHTLAQGADSTINEIISFGLRERGGETYWMGQKINLARKQSSCTKYIVCCTDEDEREALKTRFIMTSIPYQLIEGMTIAAYAAGAAQGYIYIRHEHQESQRIMKGAIIKAREYGLLGEQILGNDFSFDIEVISEGGCSRHEEDISASRTEENCGRSDETDSDTVKSLSECRTVAHNAETLTNIPKIITRKRSWKRALGQMTAREQKEAISQASEGKDYALPSLQQSFEILSGAMADE